MRSLVDILATFLRGPRCVVCGDRTKWMRAHLWIDHGGKEFPS
jgi:hypothetical protein